MKNLMLDLETMGTTSDAAVTAIGAAFFDIKTGRVDATFDMQVNLQNEIDAGASVSAGTIQFWLSQPHGVAEKAMFETPVNARSALDMFVQWVKAYDGPGNNDVKLWGNGAVFDNVIIENAFRRHGIESPFKFWNHRDVRTVLDLSREMGYDAREETPFEGTEHVALDDVKHQVAYLSAAYRHITGKESNPNATHAGKWIKWDGTGVPPSGIVRVKFRNGDENEERGLPASRYYWKHMSKLNANGYDIVAYKQIPCCRCA